MSLPGKLCVGILEEDNPLKSYFRFKPLLVYQPEGYAPFDGEKIYPEDGCLRIVPDKNESGHFKARMRRIGCYALLDLRAHPAENDKIRPNKNYQVDPTEKNAYIVYSDVVVEPPEGMLYEVLDRAAPADSTHIALTLPMPGTRQVLLREAGECWNLWTCDPIEDVDGAVSLTREEAQARPAAGTQVRVPLRPDEEVCLLLAAPEASLLVDTAPQPPQPQPQPPAGDAPPAPPRTAHVHLNARAQAQVAQTGLNPRRNRSLQEIIDDKWRRSRIDQLGHPVPAEAMATPVTSPVERALEALREAWRIEDARAALAEAVASLDGLGPAVRNRADLRADDERTRRLNELEAQRLRLLDEIDALQKRRADLREQLLEEVRRENESVLAQDARRLEALKGEIAALEQRAQDARAALESAEASFAQLDKRLCERALENRVARYWNAPPPPPRPEVWRPCAGELISSVRAYLEAAGATLSHDQAVLLLCAFANFPLTIVYGDASAPADLLARLLAGALGLERWGRYLEVPDEPPFPPPPPVAADCDAPVLVGARSVRRALAALRRLGPQARAVVCATEERPQAADVQGACLFYLEGESCERPWSPPAQSPDACERAVSFEALRSIFAGSPECPCEEVRERMARLRAQLGLHGVRVSRRCLDAVWRMCAQATPLLHEHTPLQALDAVLSMCLLPQALLEAPLEALGALEALVTDLQECHNLLQRPLPIL